MSWKSIELAKVCEVFADGDWIESKDQSDIGIRLIQTGNVGFGIFKARDSKARYINEETFKRLRCTEIKEGDLLVSRLPEPVGRACIIPQLVDKSITAVDCTIIRTKQEILYSNYLNYYCQSPQYFEQVKKNITGATRQRISRSLLGKTLIPLAPLPLQQKIVAKLDAIFAEIDTATAAAEANVNNAKQLFESYLKDVFENKSKKFESKKINEISINLDSKRVPITKDLRTNGDVPYYGASGIVDYVSDFLFEEDILLVSEDGANLLDRNYPIAFSVSGKSWVNNHAHVLKFENMISQKFVEFYINSISLKPYVSGMAQPKLNQGMLNKIPIPFPNITIQKDLVNDFETMKENRNILLNSYVKKNSELALLKNSILQKAFNGELVKD